jgi:hypothetical protein
VYINPGKGQINGILKLQLYGKMRKVSQEVSLLPEMQIMLQQFASFGRRTVKASVVRVLVSSVCTAQII